MAPVIDPVAAVTLCADVSNVDTVIVDGVVRKRDGKLLADVDTGPDAGRGLPRLPARRGRAAKAGGMMIDATWSAAARTAAFVRAGGWAAGATGYRRWTIVGEDDGAVHTGFGLCELEPGGAVPAHLHSFEESFYVVDGTGVLQTPRRAPVGSARATTGCCRSGSRTPGATIGDAPVAVGRDAGARSRGGASATTPFLVPALPAGGRGASTCATRATGGSATSPATHGRRPGRARTCWRCPRACARRCWSTAASRSR